MEIKEIYANDDDKVMYLKGLIRLAKADGHVSAEEEDFFYNAAIGLGLQSDMATYLKALLKDNSIKAKDISISFDSKKKVLFFIRDAVQLCFMDGEYSQEERNEIKSIGTEADILNETITKIEEWVERGSNWRIEGDKLLELED